MSRRFNMTCSHNHRDPEQHNRSRYSRKRALLDVVLSVLILVVLSLNMMVMAADDDDCVTGVTDGPNDPPLPQCGSNNVGSTTDAENQAATNNPIILGRGAVKESATDIVLPGPLWSYSHSRTYNSRLESGRDGKGLFATNGHRWIAQPQELYAFEDGDEVAITISASSHRVFTNPQTSGGSWPNTVTTYDPPEDYNATLQKVTIQDDKDYDNDGILTDDFDIFILTETDTNNVYIFCVDRATSHVGTQQCRVSARGQLVEKTTREYQEQSLDGTLFSYNSDAEMVAITTPDPQAWTIAYKYYTTPEANRIESIKVWNGIADASEDDTGAIVTMKAEYTYYGNVSGTKSHLGTSGDLVQVKVSRRADGDTGSTYSIVRYTQYRYDSNHRLTMVIEPDAIERITSAGNTAVDTPEEILNKADTYIVADSVSLKQYSSRYFTYYTTNLDTDSSQTTPWGSQNLSTKYGGDDFDETDGGKTAWVKTETVNGDCGCGGGSGGGITHNYFYMDLNTGSSTDTNEVVRIVVEDTEDADGNAVYRRVYGLNDDNVALRQAFIADPTLTTQTVWCNSKIMNSDKRATESRQASAHTAVVNDTTLKQFLDPYDAGTASWANDTATLNTTAGVIAVMGYDANGYRQSVRVKEGKNGTLHYLSYIVYGDGTDDKPTHLPIATYEFPTQVTSNPTTNGIATTFTYTFWDTADTQVKSKTTTLPAISSGQNGSGVATTMAEHYDDRGRLRWTKDGEGYVDYYSYHPETGGLAFVVKDVNPASPGTEVTSGSGSGETQWEAWTVGDADGNAPTRGASATALALTAKHGFDYQGRRVVSIDSGGAKHYTLYGDDRTIVFPYWDGATGQPLMPIRVTETNEGGQVVDMFTMKPSQATSSGTSPDKVPTGVTSTVNQNDTITWSHYTYNSVNGQLEFVDRYHDIPSGTSRSFGTVSTNFYRTVHQYDELGRQEYVIQQVSGAPNSSGVEQVTQMVYDVRDRVIKTLRGVSAAGSDMGADYSTYPTMDEVSEVFYDGADMTTRTKVGDGHVTKSIQYHGTGANDYTGVNYHLTWRGHMRGVEPFYHNGSAETAIGPFAVQDVDWMGRTIASAAYDANPTWATVLGNDDYAATVITDRRSLSKTHFDDLGRVYQTEQITIAASDGSAGDKFVSNNYFDRNGRLVATGQMHDAHMEFAYDGVGRQYQRRVVMALNTTKYSGGAFDYRAPDPDPVMSEMANGDDGVIEFTHIVFDASGGPIEQHMFEVNDAVGIDLTNDDNYVRSSVYFWYDDANRQIAVANFGSGDTTTGAGSWKYVATVPTRDSTAPTSSTDLRLVTTFGYNTDTGRMETVTDPMGTVTRTFHDDLGRRAFVAENWDNYSPGSGGTGDATDKSKDRVTQTVYNGLNQVTALIALDANGDGNTSDNQQTNYLFEDAHNASLVTNIIYPDSSDTDSSGSDQVKFTYNVDGSIATKTDQLGTVHTFSYNDRRQLEYDDVTTLGTGVDGHVRSIKREYDELARLERISSYQNTSGGGTVRNDIAWEYNDLGQVTTSWQSHEGAALTSGGSESPKVQYGYDLSAISSTYSDGARLDYVLYPSGREIRYRYGGQPPLGDRLHRVTGIRDVNNTQFVGYSFIGTRRTVTAAYTNITLNLTYHQGDGDDDYEGFDRFGRVKDQFWNGFNGTDDADRFLYEYDFAGNRSVRDIDSTIYASNDKDQAYTYDGLHRLDGYDRGTLSSGSIATPNFEQDFGYDQLGNWARFIEKTSGSTTLDQTRTHNDANEITGISETTGPTWIDPVYNAAGNMTEAPSALPGQQTTKHKYVYDAWNHLVKVTDASDNVIAEYEYDPLNRRIVKDVSGGDVLHYYFNEMWQILEVRKEVSGTEDPDPLKQYVWHDPSAVYIDAPAIRFYDADLDGTADRQYFTFDANYNVTALIDTSGAVLERYEHTPYGQVTILDPDFSDDADNISDYEQDVLFQGTQYDVESGLHHVRNRMLHPGLGRWLQRDPIGYVDGISLYEYIRSAPHRYGDPHGLEAGEWERHGDPWIVIVDVELEFSWSTNTRIFSDPEIPNCCWLDVGQDLFVRKRNKHQQHQLWRKPNPEKGKFMDAAAAAIANAQAFDAQAAQFGARANAFDVVAKVEYAQALKWGIISAVLGFTGNPGVAISGSIALGHGAAAQVASSASTRYSRKAGAATAAANAARTAALMAQQQALLQPDWVETTTKGKATWQGWSPWTFTGTRHTFFILKIPCP